MKLNLSDLQRACSDCEFNTVCGGGCRSRAFVQRGNFTDPNPLCPFNQGLEVE